MELAQIRRRQMDRALRWAILLFSGFLLVTQQVLTYGPLVDYDRKINSKPKPQFEGLAGFILRRLDDLGLRWLTATVLLIAAAFIAYKFKTWRPLNLALLSLINLLFYKKRFCMLFYIYCNFDFYLLLQTKFLK